MTPLWFWEHDWPLTNVWIHNIVWTKEYMFEVWVKRVR